MADALSKRDVKACGFMRIDLNQEANVDSILLARVHVAGGTVQMCIDRDDISYCVQSQK